MKGGNITRGAFHVREVFKDKWICCIAGRENELWSTTKGGDEPGARCVSLYTLSVLYWLAQEKHRF
jgi:hypothetical protein